ncbi:O-antigen ligase family protein [Cellulomonas xylanilytica]|uniref:O-antigen ligase family protein n=1 Tax=Cellulomonas xylanilytica TaxID=233583 RepID=UPI001649E372|nr:O-antigen ligase family protein [Cellulomonas xylanilytica]
MLVAILACAAFGRLARPAFSSVWPVLALLSLAAGLLTGAGVNPTASFWTGARFAIIIGLAPFVLAFYVRASPRFAIRATWAFVAVQTVSALAGFLQFGGAAVLGQVARGGRANGLAGHPNILGLMSSLALLAVLRWVIGRNKGWLPALVVLVPIHLGTLVTSGSLSGTMALVVGLPVLLVAQRAVTRIVSAGLLVVAIVVPVASAGGASFAFLGDRVSERVSSVSGVGDDATGSLLDREQTYNYAIESIRTHPVIGRGLDGESSGTFNGVTVVHNYPLRAWFQGGVLLAVVALVVYSMGALAVVNGIVQGRWALPVAVVAAILVYAGSAAFLVQYQYWIPLLLAFAALPSSVRRTGGAVRDPRSTPPALRSSNQAPVVTSSLVRPGRRQG